MTHTQTPTMSSARIAVLVMFFINGALLANWVSRIPRIQDDLELSEGGLGLVLLGLSAGVLTALSAAGGLVGRYGSRRVTVTAAILLCLFLPPLALMPSALALWAGLFVFGMALSTMDVAMNAQAVDVEKGTGHALLSTFHAAFSIGGFVGAAFGAAMASLDILPTMHFLIAAMLFLVLTLTGQRNLLQQAAASSAVQDEPVFQMPSRVLWPLGIVAFAGAIGEGAMADWSGVYLSDVVETDAGTAALGFAVFSFTMTLGRLSGDWLSTRYSPMLLVRAGGLIAALGLMLAILFPQTLTTLVGFAAVGLGLSTVVPLAFSAAGRVPGISSSTGIAGVATIGYAGFLAGPPVIGLLADATSLPVSLLLVAVLMSTLMVTGRVLRQAVPLAEAEDPYFVGAIEPTD